jgi:uncharacterized coiled-coil DUF342 family protein
MIKDSKDPQVQEFRKEIDALKKQRNDHISKMKEYQHKLSYKMAEQEAIARLIEMEKKKPRKENIGKLKKMRHSLEFRISTESLNLQQEKTLIMRINELNAQLDEAFKQGRLERKRGLISTDIEHYSKELQEKAKSIGELDAKLDGLYSNIRKILGISKYKPKPMQKSKEKQQQKPQHDINLEDIVVIKKKEKKSAEKEEDSE